MKGGEGGYDPNKINASDTINGKIVYKTFSSSPRNSYKHCGGEAAIQLFYI